MIQLDRTNPEHRAFARLVLAKRDIESAFKVISYVIDKIKVPYDELFDPLSCASTIFYCRPFIARRQFPGIPKRYSEFPDANLKVVHSHLIDNRNRFEAHRDEDFNIVSLIGKGSVVTWGNGKGQGILSSHGENISSNSLKLEAFPEMKKLSIFQIERLKAKIDSEKERLFP